MSDHKAPLTIVGMTHTGKTKNLISAAIDHHKTQTSPGDITLFISNETTPAVLAQMAGLNSSEDFTREGLRDFFFVTQDNALNILEDVAPSKNRFLFIDCVTETSLSIDHNGLFVSFIDTPSANLNAIAKMGTLCGVTASNWGG